MYDVAGSSEERNDSVGIDIVVSRWKLDGSSSSLRNPSSSFSTASSSSSSLSVSINSGSWASPRSPSIGYQFSSKSDRKLSSPILNPRGYRWSCEAMCRRVKAVSSISSSSVSLSSSMGDRSSPSGRVGSESSSSHSWYDQPPRLLNIECGPEHCAHLNAVI